MVTDEERSYLCWVYAYDPQARINLGIRRRRIELMYGLLFALPGTPVIYYGDEFGMGDNMFRERRLLAGLAAGDSPAGVHSRNPSGAAGALHYTPRGEGDV